MEPRPFPDHVCLRFRLVSLGLARNILRRNHVTGIGKFWQIVYWMSFWWRKMEMFTRFLRFLKDRMKVLGYLSLYFIYIEGKFGSEEIFV